MYLETMPITFQQALLLHHYFTHFFSSANPYASKKIWDQNESK